MLVSVEVSCKFSVPKFAVLIGIRVKGEEMCHWVQQTLVGRLGDNPKECLCRR